MFDLRRWMRTFCDIVACCAGAFFCFGLETLSLRPQPFLMLRDAYVVIGAIAGLACGLTLHRQRAGIMRLVILAGFACLVIEAKFYSAGKFALMADVLAIFAAPLILLLISQAIDWMLYRNQSLALVQSVDLKLSERLVRLMSCIASGLKLASIGVLVYFATEYRAEYELWYWVGLLWAIVGASFFVFTVYLYSGDRKLFGENVV